MTAIWLGFALQLLSINADLITQNRDFLIEELQNESIDLRINAAQKLGELRFPEAVTPLSGLAQDPVPEVRFAAIRALSRYVNQEALDALNTAFANETEPYLKAEVRRSKKSIEDFLKSEADKAEQEKAGVSKKKK